MASFLEVLQGSDGMSLDGPKSSNNSDGIFDACLEELTCPSCKKLYCDVKNPPLTTSCGHTICSPCLTDGLTEKKNANKEVRCFTCHEKLAIASADDLPLNHTIARLANFMSFKMLYPGIGKCTTTEEDEKEIVTVMPKEKLETSTDSIGQCKDHQSTVISRCTLCKVWMCGACVRNHKNTSLEDKKCEVVPASKEMRVIKESENTLTRLQIDKLNLLKGDLLARMAFLNTRKWKNQVVTTTLKEELLQIEVNVRGIEQKINFVEEKMSEVHSWIETLLESRSKTFLAETLDDLETSKEETNRYMKEVTDWMLTEKEQLEEDGEDTHFTIPRSSGPVGLEYLKQRVILSQDLYTIDNKEGISRWAKLTICDKNLILHAHETTEPPKGATLVPYKELTDTMPSLPGAFLDIAWDGEIQGRVFFHFFSVNSRSLQCLLLSMGDTGPSYKGTKLMPHGISYLMSITDPTFSNRSILYGGHYNEDKSKDGCPAIYDNIKDEGEHIRLKAVGLLAGMPCKDEQYLAMFKVYLEVSEDVSFCDTAFGYVDKGLPVLLEAARKLSETDVTVQDCGVFFPVW